MFKGHNSCKNIPPGLIFELFWDIIELKLLYKFYPNQMRTEFARVLTRNFCHFFKGFKGHNSFKNIRPELIFELPWDIIELKLLRKYYKNWMWNKLARALTRKIHGRTEGRTHGQTNARHYYIPRVRVAAGDKKIQPEQIIFIKMRVNIGNIKM